MKTALVADGYNGHTVEVNLQPVLEETENTVKLQITGKEHLSRWVWKRDLM